jgi:hypothetical protein
MKKIVSYRMFNENEGVAYNLNEKMRLYEGESDPAIWKANLAKLNLTMDKYMGVVGSNEDHSISIDFEDDNAFKLVFEMTRKEEVEEALDIILMHEDDIK